MCETVHKLIKSPEFKAMTQEEQTAARKLVCDKCGLCYEGVNN